MSLTVLGILVLLAGGLAWLGWRRSSVAVLVLTLAGAVAMHKACANRADGRQPHDAIDQRIWNIPRHPVAGLRHQRG